MTSRKQLLQMVSNAALCYVPDEELTEEQLERLDNIQIGFCNCEMCKGYSYGSLRPQEIQWSGHANKEMLTIGISEPFFRETKDIPIFLLQQVATVLHEIIHILFPDISEKQAERKTWAWLRKTTWINDPLMHISS